MIYSFINIFLFFYFLLLLIRSFSSMPEILPTESDSGDLSICGTKLRVFLFDLTVLTAKLLVSFAEIAET